VIIRSVDQQAVLGGSRIGEWLDFAVVGARLAAAF
jgi:hypothetical protein